MVLIRESVVIKTWNWLFLVNQKKMSEKED